MHRIAARRHRKTSTHPARLAAGWSSPVARQAHNLKVTGSNPVPATKHPQSPPPGAALSFPHQPAASPTSKDADGLVVRAAVAGSCAPLPLGARKSADYRALAFFSVA